MARRGTGEGSIYRDSEGYWRSAIVIGWTSDGKPKRKTFRSKQRAIVVRKLNEAIAARDSGFLTTGAVPTVGEWLDHWLTVIAPDRIRESTRAGYAGYLKRYLVPLLGRHRLDRLRPEHIEKSWAELSTRGLSPATIRQAHRILSRALTVAVRRGHLVRNPATLLDGPSVVRAEVPSYTPAQARALIEAAAADRLASRWTAGLALGLRQGEVLGLAWDAVDLDAGTLTVRRALQRQAGRGLVLVEPKSMRSRRTVAMPTELTAQLRARRTEQLEERLAAGSAWRGGGPLGELVWTQADGAPIDPRADWAAWRKLCDRAGVPRLRLHDARHTAASLLLVQGVPARVVMGILGHSTVQLTLDTYSHVAPELAEQAAVAMSAALWGGAGTR
ncbi:tyrosine-type recombinase/integrase [Modestobacter sp. VKM Ac-2985]|uniref:tyrosine-type recombinase/integrase n=1 Tax=Modestobacter sp. VKM Ac-2985 TaxID=3004139 RepID=UPI0022AB6E33|nr:site-specific integrase [Modestobacter sp. VKM Ac-2985]MCZ2837183.1 site-specific integrase [Modestobacter sp. VKM Ac-2985]